MLETVTFTVRGIGLIDLIPQQIDRISAFIFYSDAQQQVAEDAVHRMVNRAIEMEGTITGEHGIGLVKRDYLPHEIGQGSIDTMRTVSPKRRYSRYKANYSADQASTRSLIVAESRRSDQVRSVCS